MTKLDKTTHIQVAIKLGMEQGIAIEPHHIKPFNTIVEGKKEWYVRLQVRGERDITIWKSVDEQAYFEALECRATGKRFIIPGEIVEVTTIQPLWEIRSPNSHEAYNNIN
jgi:hypothetical protein